MKKRSRSLSQATRSRAAVRQAARHLAAGESDLEQGRLAEAARQATRALALDGNHLGALELLARAVWKSGEYEKSLDVLRHLIRLNPFEPGYHFMRGGALQALGHYGEAVRAFERCLASNNEPLKASAWAAVQDLESWQEDIVASMIKSEKVFALQYASDAQNACRSRGFYFIASSAAHDEYRAGFAAKHPEVWSRPS